MPLQLINAPALLHGPCTLQHGDPFLRNVENHLPSDALPNTRRPETSWFLPDGRVIFLSNVMASQEKMVHIKKLMEENLGKIVP